MRINWCQAVFDNQEIDAVVECLKKGWLGGNGDYTKKFELEVASTFGKKYGVFVNSGSSGLLAVLHALGLEKGTEVITPACNFSTMVSTLVNCNLVPHLIDVNPHTYVVEPEAIEEAIGPNTRAVLLPLLIGSIPKLDEIREICKRHGVWLIEDSCDQVGGRFKKKSTGEFTDISLTSFYGSHHLTAGGGGGMICVDSPGLQEKLYSLRDWGHRVITREEDRFSYQLNGVFYDGHFTYDHLAFNLKACEMQAAFGLVQLKKLPSFNEVRKRHFHKLKNYFVKKEFLRVPEELPGAEVSWIAFPLTLLSNTPLKRDALMRKLFDKGIQSRPVFAGNILYHPMMRGVNAKITSSLKNSDYIFENSFMVGCHHAMTDEMSDYMIETFEEIFRK